tara:strand:+ start:187 stop:381 length:195 start_codon:yes stop_codon:yes gene_type:complete
LLFQGYLDGLLLLHFQPILEIPVVRYFLVVRLILEVLDFLVVRYFLVVRLVRVVLVVLVYRLVL